MNACLKKKYDKFQFTAITMQNEKKIEKKVKTNQFELAWIRLSNIEPKLWDWDNLT